MPLNRQFSSLIIFCSAALALAALPRGAAAEVFFESQNHPALWKIENGDTKIYLFGSHHILRRDTAWITATLVSLVEEADEFVFEVEPTEEWMPDAQAYIDDSGYLPAGERLDSLLPEESRDSFRTLVRGLPLNPREIDKQQPWLALLTLSSAFYGKRRYAVEYGADVRIMSAAVRADKPIHYLETPRQQLEYFSAAMMTMPHNGLDVVVDSLFREPDEIVDNIRDWREGNVDGPNMRLQRYLDYGSPARRILLDDRNAAWAARIEEFADDGKTFFVTVGIGHFGGPGNIVEILCRNGWAVERVPTDGEAVPEACPG